MAEGKSRFSSTVRASLAVSPSMFLYFFAVMITGPAQQQLLYDKLCYESYPDDFDDGLCSNKDFITAHPDIQSTVSMWSLYLRVAEFAPAILVSLYFGLYCDLIGQRVPMLVPLTGHIIIYGCTALMAWFVKWPVYLMLFPAILNGLLGSMIGLFLAITTILSRRSSEDVRSTLLVLVEGFLPLGTLLSQVSSGYMLQYWGITWMYVVAGGTMMLNWISCFIFVTDDEDDDNVKLHSSPKRNIQSSESNFGDGQCENEVGDAIVNGYSPYSTDSRDTTAGIDNERHKLLLKHNHKLRWYHLFEYGLFKDILVTFLSDKYYSSGRRASIWLTYLLFAMILGSEMGPMGILYIYLTKELGLSEIFQGYYMGAMSGASLLGSILGPLLFMRLLKMSDVPVIVVSMALTSVAIFSFGLSSRSLSFLWVYIGLHLFYIAGLACSKSLISKLVRKEDMGKAFCLLYSCQSLSTMITGLLFNSLYAWSVSFEPGLCFFGGSFYCVVCIVICLILERIGDRSIIAY